MQEVRSKPRSCLVWAFPGSEMGLEMVLVEAILSLSGEVDWRVRETSLLTGHGLGKPITQSRTTFRS